MRVLAGDIGGTHARLALVEIGGGQARILEDRTYSSQAARGLAPLVEEFLRGKTERPAKASFGIAGPVVDGKVAGTNLPWAVAARALGEAICIPATTLINDFAAVGYGIRFLRADDVVTLQRGEPEEHGPIALLGAGTGLGAGFLLWEGNGYRVCASEGGHVTWAPRTADELALHAFLSKRYEHVSCERVISGPGLAAIYESLTGRLEDSAAISERAMAGADPDATRSLDLFVAAFGAAAGNVGLTVLATAGVYLAGGIAPRIVAKLREGAFLAAFRSKGRMAGLMARLPVHVVTTPDVGLLGAAAAVAGP